MSRDIVDSSALTDRLVVAARIEGQPADQLSRLGVEHAYVAIGERYRGALALEPASIEVGVGAAAA